MYSDFQQDKKKFWDAVDMTIPGGITVISGINECVNLFQWARSAISSLRSRWSGTEEQTLQDEVLHLQSGLLRLRDTLPAMCDLIDRAEWRIHEQCMAKLLPKLRDAVYDADDLLDEFGWYELKVAVEGNASQSPFVDFFNSVIQGSFNKVEDIQKRLKNLSRQLEEMGLREETPHFDKSVRPDTSSLPDETKIFGRDLELKQVIGLLGVPTNISGAHLKRKRASTVVRGSTSTSSNISNKSRIPSIPVLPIVGLGGVGKTTLAQHICNHQQVKSYFDLVIWICVSDDFDVTRLTKEAVQASSDNLDSLQRALSKNVRNKRFLIVLDDMWDDALKENGLCWKRFCAPLRNVIQGSMILVTTRSPKVADGVGTMEPFILDGLKDDVFWNFFKLCVFGSESSNSEPELELIGRSILPKLKGSPLAAKTLGRLLKMNLHVTHWNKILESELWELRQNETEILPALRLSYMYLPFHLKRCFSFCAVYPKDHKFEKDYLAEIWVAEGLVEPQGDIPIQDIGCQYFEDLVERSFFQKVRDTYGIHDLLYDMAQLVSEHDCFVIKNMSDFQKVPQDVRRLSILSSTKFDRSTLLSLCKHTKLRTLFCNKSLRNKTVASVVVHWFNELRHMRVIIFSAIEELPDSVGNLKHLRYLKISRACPFDSLPSAICCLYNLQIFSASECKLESLPSDFSKLISLQRFESNGFQYDQDCPLNFDADSERGLRMRLLKNVTQFCGDLEICNLSMRSKDHAAQVELKNKRYLNGLTLGWSLSTQGHSEIEVLQVLQPSINLKSLLLRCYPGVSLPNWFQPQNLANLTSLSLHNCDGLESISFSRISQRINLNDMRAVPIDNNNDSIGTFLALTVISIYMCKNVSSLEQVLHPASVPAIKKITIQYCNKLVSVPTERFEDLHCLEELYVSDCPNIYSYGLVAPSLERLVLGSSGNLAGNIECSSLVCLSLSCHCVTSIEPQMWSLPALLELNITGCRSLTSIGQPEPFFTNISRGGGTTSVIFSSLTSITIYDCEKLSNIDDLLTEEYLPAIESILVGRCGKLISLSSETFGSFPFLKDLKVHDCPSINWQSGLALPSSLQRLYLRSCGDISAWVPSSLENLASLVSLQMIECPRVVSIPGEVWSSDLTSLKELKIEDCPDLVSIGGANAIAEINNVCISGCPKMKENAYVMRGRF
ncbi:hypothetical protein VPH35_106145 [Triticum aestivum]|uniref:NB-ARC domain-containing protein n=1 Tax=Triticum aestivum TaxID=4565 RepID=A0A3B6NST3_WHEAT